MAVSETSPTKATEPLILVSHPLDGATLRVNRAMCYMDETDRMFESFRAANKNKVTVKANPQERGGLLVDFDKSLVVPLELSLPVSDCIHNLRAALDYLVYELAAYDSKVIQERTQFPIEDNANVFWNNRRNTYLKGVSDDHAKAIYALQPCAGVNWTKNLQTISNPDKHMHLSVLRAKLAGTVMVQMGEAGSFDQRRDLQGTILKNVGIDGSDAHVQAEYLLDVGFAASDLPVIETLVKLVSKVGETIDLFKPEF